MNRKERRAAAKGKDVKTLCALAEQREKQGRFPEAAETYRRVLDFDPSLYKVHNELARMLRQQGHLDEALVHFERALGLAPDPHSQGGICNNIGTLALDIGNYARAIERLRQSVALLPHYARGYSCLAVALHSAGQTDEGIAHFQRALELDPGLLEARIDLAIALIQQGRKVEALDHAEIASRSSEEPWFPHYSFGVLMSLCGCVEAARLCLNRYLEREPGDSKGARLLLATLGDAIPERASEAQMRTLYASRAGFWDQGTTSPHGYRGADLVSSALDRFGGEGLDIADAGCGTGLVGKLVARRARQLVGIDLSAAMMQKARDKGVYHRLHEGDLIAFLNDHPDSFDAVTCAATLIHFGDLRPAFDAAAESLRDRGLFIFTLFPNEDDEHAVSAGALDGLVQGGCYRHGHAYVTRLAEVTGFVVETLERVIHEYNHQQPRMGLLVALRRLPRDRAQAA
jgi:predicted TPR repeat methyltransferase